MVSLLIEEKNLHKIEELKVKDSKLLTPKQREHLFDKILKVVKDKLVTIVSPKEIDEAVSSESINLNWLEAIKTAEMINKLKPDKAILDCPSPNTRAYADYVRKHLKNKSIEIIAEHHAESKFPIVAASSIIAKVTRDREIEKIKKEIGLDFGSLHFNEEVLIENHDGLKLEKIGPLIENGPWNLKVYSLNLKDYHIKSSKVIGFIEHPRTRIYNLRFSYGKSLRASSNHPLFTLNQEGILTSKKVSELNPGDWIACCGKISCNMKMRELNLIKLFKNYSNKKSPIYISNKNFKKFIEKNFLKIQKKALKLGYIRTSPYQWLKKGYIPLHVLNELGKIRFDLKEAYLFSNKGNDIKIPALFKIDREFMWFLGIYIAEGWITDYKLCISSLDKKTLNRIARYSKKLNVNHHFDKDWVSLGSIILVKLIKALNIGRYAREKRAPDFVFTSGEKNISAFLDGIYEGDGWIKCSNFEIELYSQELIKQIQWLNLLRGKFCSNKERKQRNSYITRILSKSTNSLSPDNLPGVLGFYLKRVREKNNYLVTRLAKKINMSPNQLINIEKGRTGSIQKKTLEKILKVIKDKKLKKLIKSDLCWVKLEKKEFIEYDKVYDLSVTPHNGKIENFIVNTGIIVHNSGYPADPTTQKFLKENYNNYPNIFRKTWSSFRRLGKKEGQKNLSEF